MVFNEGGKIVKERGQIVTGGLDCHEEGEIVTGEVRLARGR